ncbi:MAG: FAD-dependent oxidoreductase [Cellulomonadaceae bacterium]|nr:FAD-dependent oxidoreductase [Cellulomonadaceae bacterium]
MSRYRPTVFERHQPDRGLVDSSLASSRHAVYWQEDVPAVRHSPLVGASTADLTVVGGGYAGLWTAVHAKLRDPGARVTLLEAATIGWAASGRNGGFVAASLTHGEENGRRRWPAEHESLARLGAENLSGFVTDIEQLGMNAQLERTGSLAVALEPHQVPWIAEPSEHFLDAAAVGERITIPLALGAQLDTDETVLVHPVRLVRELARVACELGVEVHERSRVVALEGGGPEPVVVRTPEGRVLSDRVALGTNVFPSLVRRARPLTVPVYDYVLMTEPLTPDQRAAVGWAGREGYEDLGNQFHYARLTADDRILFGGYDAVYPHGGRMDVRMERRPATYERLAAHFFTLFPQLEGVRFSHRWAGAIDTSTQFCAFHGLARGGRVAYAAGFTGLGLGATRFAADVMLDRLDGLATERTGSAMVRRLPWPFPPEPVATVGIELTRWSLDRADHREGRRNALLRVLDAVGLGFDS